MSASSDTLTDPMERFYNSIDIQDTGCWQWNKSLTKGYGAFWIGSNYRSKVHRFSYWLFVGRSKAVARHYKKSRVAHV